MIDYNEIENFSRADGRTQEKFALRKLGKILKQRKSNVLDVLRQEGIRVPKKAKPRFIIKAIRKNLNNRRLRDKLAIMMLWDSTLDGAVARAKTSDFIGTKADGSARLLGSGEKLAGLFKSDPNKVKGAGWEKLGNFFKGDPNRERKPFGETGFGQLFQKDPNKERKAFGDTKFGQGFNNLFKRGVDSETGEKTTSKFGDFLRANTENIGTLGASLFGGLFGKKGEEEVANSYDNTSRSTDGGQPPAPQGVPMMNIILFGGLAIAGVVAVVYFTNRGSGNKAKASA